MIEKPTRLLDRAKRYFLLIIILGALTGVRAELLPVKTYTTAEGLLRDEVYRIRQDSRGFLWFCTGDGLSRFDGYGFVNYTTDDGLPHRLVTDLLEAHNGVYWVATNDGLARFNPRGKRSDSISNQQSAISNSPEPMFVVFRPPDSPAAKGITVLFEDAHGLLWCGTEDGLYWFEERDYRGTFHRVELEKERASIPLEVSAIIQDKRGGLWVGMDNGQGLNRILPDGRVEHYATRYARQENESIKTLLETKDGEIWAGMSLDAGLCALVAEPDPHRPILSRCYTKKDGIAANWIGNLYQTSDGRLWVNTVDGLSVFNPKASSSGPAFVNYKEAQGLCDKGGYSVLEDRDGNIWVATTCGVKKIARSGFVRYTQADGLVGPVNGIFTSHAGELFVVTKQTVETHDKKPLDVHLINRFDQDRFISVAPRLPPGSQPGWGGGQIIVHDTAGDWWLPSANTAAYRFPQTDDLKQLANAKPEAISIPDDSVFRIYEDLRSDIWISTVTDGHLLKRERATGTLRDFKQEITSSQITRYASWFAEDKAGTLWIGSEYDDSLMRYKDGRIAIIPTKREKVGDATNTLYFDHLGRLWLASKLNGVGRIDDPNIDPLNIVWYTRKNGLATDGTRGLVEDQFGRIYVGHGRGVDRIDPNTGQIKHYTSADGLPQGAPIFSARDAQGALWFGGPQGLARLVPEQDKPRQTPNILLTGLRLAGVRQGVSELGEISLPVLRLDSNQTQVNIEFVGLGASIGEELRYQYKLEGANGDWLETTQRTVDFANLAPGSYRFLVRAVTFDGLVSQTPATVSFTIAAPIWKRWWFVTLVLLTIAGLAFVGYRYRVIRLLELERVRTRIATDLHDDIGANLSKISILSEVARQRYEPNGNGETPLGSIADISRESVASMSDIVWAINPRKDSLIDLTSRMRRFAEDTLESRDITLDFRAPDAGHEMKLGADARRAIYLIFKEGLNNIVRHSRASRAAIDLRIEAKELLLEISDDGKGFDSTAERDGNGLLSMKKRAEEFGGALQVESVKDHGTTIRLRVPLSAQARMSLRS